MEITDVSNTDKNENKSKLSPNAEARLNKFKDKMEESKLAEEAQATQLDLIKSKINSQARNEQTYVMAIHDLCARYELSISTILNVVVEMMNTKNHYLKLIGQMRQEQQQQQGESISSK
jgi:hypothetical protein